MLHNILHHMVFGNANLSELVWTIIVLIGSLVAFVNSRESLLDWLYLKRSKRDGRLRLIALQQLESALFIQAIQFLFLVIGISAMFTPEPKVLSVSLEADVIIIILLFASLLLTIRSILHRQLRIAILKTNRLDRPRKSLKAMEDKVNAVKGDKHA